MRMTRFRLHTHPLHLGAALALLCALVGSAAQAQEPAAVEETTDYRGALDQARFQIRKGYYDQAIADLERTVQHPDGRLDAEPWFLLAQVRLQVGDIVGARRAAAKALTYSKDVEQESQSAALVGLLDNAWGLVAVDASQPGTAWRPRLEPAQPLMDPGQGEIVDLMAKRIRKSRSPLPRTVGLPVGDWDVNGHAVSVTPAQTARVTLSPREAAGGLAAARLAWIELDAGVVASLSKEPHVQPSPALQLGLNVPVGGPVLVGVFGDWTALSLRTQGGSYTFDGRTGSVGVRFGPMIDDGEVVLVRPAIGYRYGGIAGLLLGCDRQGDGWLCHDRDATTPSDLLLYADGTAHVPFIEVSADWLDRRRTSGVGAGVRVGVEHAFGRLKDGGKSRGEPLVEYTVHDDARSPARTSLRVLLHASVAL